MWFPLRYIPAASDIAHLKDTYPKHFQSWSDAPAAETRLSAGARGARYKGSMPHLTSIFRRAKVPNTLQPTSLDENKTYLFRLYLFVSIGGKLGDFTLQ